MSPNRHSAGRVGPAATSSVIFLKVAQLDANSKVLVPPPGGMSARRDGAYDGHNLSGH